MPRNATLKATTDELSPVQATVLEALLRGETVTAAATAANVDRSTVHRWLRSDLSFQAACNRGRRELWEASAGRLLRAAHTAAETVANAVESGDVQVALAVLKGIGALSGTVPMFGSDDPGELAESARRVQNLLDIGIW